MSTDDQAIAQMAKAAGLNAAMMKTISESVMGIALSFRAMDADLALTPKMVADQLEESASAYLGAGIVLLLEEQAARAACPECRAGKHVNCTGWALDEETDEMIDCPCPDPSHPFNQGDGIVAAMIPGDTASPDQEGDSA